MENRTPLPSAAAAAAAAGGPRSAGHARVMHLATSVISENFAEAAPPNRVDGSSLGAAGSSQTSRSPFVLTLCDASEGPPPSPGMEADLLRAIQGLDRKALQRVCVLLARDLVAARDELGDSRRRSPQRARSAAEPSEGTPKLVRRGTVARPLGSGEADEATMLPMSEFNSNHPHQNLAPFAASSDADGRPGLQDSFANSSDDEHHLVPVLAVEAELDEDVEEGDRSRALTPQLFSLSPGLTASNAGAPVDRFNLSTSAVVHMDQTGDVEQVNHLLFFEKLGTGATGTVWQCIDDACGEHRAVKIIPRTKLSTASPVVGESAAPSLIDEVNFMRGLQHRHIVRLHELIDDAKRDEVFIVMDWIKGGSVASLDVHTGSCPRLRPSDVSVIAFQIGSALYHCHKLGFTHGDVKPDNILADTELLPILEPAATSPGQQSALLDESNMSFLAGDTPGSRQVSPSLADQSLTSSPMAKAAPFNAYLADFGVAAAVSGQRQCRRQSVATPRPLPQPPRLPTPEEQSMEQHPLTSGLPCGSPARWASRSTTPQRAASAMLAVAQPPAHPPSASGPGSTARYTRMHSTPMGGAIGRHEPDVLPTEETHPPPAPPGPGARGGREESRAGSASMASFCGDDRPALDSFTTADGAAPEYAALLPAAVGARGADAAAAVDSDDEEEELRRRSNIGGRAAAVQGTTPVLEAPERMLGGERTPATDMWALGVTLFALLFGRVPFFAATYAELRHKVLHEEPQWPPETASGVYGRWRRVLAEMLNKDPRRRLDAVELRRKRVARPY